MKSIKNQSLGFLFLFGIGTSALQAQNPTISDIDGNIYHTVVIGTQTWTVENLNTTKFNDGSLIPLAADSATWINLTSPGYCWYNNDESPTKKQVGAYYNWYTVNAGKLCPANWHVPSDADWTTLTTFLGGEEVAGGKLKYTGVTHWKSPNTGATNETGFQALPTGVRSFTYFTYLFYYGAWWSSTKKESQYNLPRAWQRKLSFNAASVERRDVSMESGLTVRCVKD